MTNKLFIYGTLGPGRPNEHIMQNIGGSWEDAIVFGNLYQEGWGSEMGYPGIILDKTGDKIKGFLFRSENISNHWSELDQFEGEAYTRVLTDVELLNGTSESAYIYTLKRTTTD